MNVIRELHELNGRFLAIYGDIYEEREHLPPKQMDLMQDKLISEYKEELEILLMRAYIDRAREKYRLQLEIAAYTPRSWRFLWIFKRKYNAAAKKIMAEVDAEVEEYFASLRLPEEIEEAEDDGERPKDRSEEPDEDDAARAGRKSRFISRRPWATK